MAEIETRKDLPFDINVAGAIAQVNIEHVVYFFLIIVASILRIADLAITPLSPDEAKEALAVWNFWQPNVTVIDLGSPLYFSLTALLTQIFGFGDSSMRLIPVLFGIALVPLPWFLRHRIGRLGAVIASGLFALSPIHVLISRTAGGQSAAIFGGVLFFVAWLRFRESNDGRWFIAAAAALAFGVRTDTAWMRWLAPLVAGIFLLLTGALLVWDLKRPDRFFYLLTRSNPSSWLVRGSWILGVFAALMGVWFLFGVFDLGSLEPVIWASAVAGLGVAGYTAYLFGQAEGRDLWQTPVLLWHMIGGACAVGGGTSLLAVLAMDILVASITPFAWVMLIGATMVGLMSLTELFASHTTTNAAAAMHHMTKGEFATRWWLGQFLAVVVPSASAALVIGGAPVVIGALGGVAAMAGVFLADDAFVEAGQSVPLS